MLQFAARRPEAWRADRCLRAGDRCDRWLSRVTARAVGKSEVHVRWYRLRLAQRKGEGTVEESRLGADDVEPGIPLPGEYGQRLRHQQLAL